jgi:hypothetical protein
MRTFTRAVFIVLAAAAALLMTSCGGGMNADDYAEIQLDLEVYDYDYSEVDSAEKLACQLYGYELVDLYDFELQRQLDPSLEEEIVEAYIDLAPDPDDFAELAAEMLALSYPCAEIGFDEQAAFLDGYVQRFGDSAWGGLVDDCQWLLEANTEGYVLPEDTADFLDDYDMDYRSLAAAGMVAYRGAPLAQSAQYDTARPGLVPRYISPAQEYSQQVRYAVVSQLPGEVDVESYVTLHVNALNGILDGTDTAESARASGLKSVELSAQQLEAYDRTINQYANLQPVLLNEIFTRITEELMGYQHTTGLTPDTYNVVVSSYYRILGRWQADEEMSELPREELEDQALTAACECHEIERGDFDEYEAVFTEYWTYLEDHIGPPKLDAETYVGALLQSLRSIKAEGGEIDDFLVKGIEKAGFTEDELWLFEERLQMESELYDETEALLVEQLTPMIDEVFEEQMEMLTADEPVEEPETYEDLYMAVEELGYRFGAVGELMEAKSVEFEEALFELMQAQLDSEENEEGEDEEEASTDEG